MAQLFDSHCHLQNVRFADDLPDVIGRALDAGVRRILNLATSAEDAPGVIAIADQYPGCYAAVGTHPGDLDKWSPAAEARLMELAKSSPKVVVFGEVGLDYYWKKFDHDMQRSIFRRQIAMAKELGLPLSIHCREAYPDMIADVRAEKAGEVGGVAHCFGGTLEEAKALIGEGFYLGVGGTSTYPASKDLRETLKLVGARRIILETDAPYLPPQPHRGKRNEPGFVGLTADALAKLLDLDYGELTRSCWANTMRAFRIMDPEATM